jgi:hypothetical protein
LKLASLDLFPARIEIDVSLEKKRLFLNIAKSNWIINRLLVLGTLSLCFSFTALKADCAEQQKRDQLPTGSYLYLGTKPGSVPQRPFTIDENGNVVWEKDNTPPPDQSTTKFMLNVDLAPALGNTPTLQPSTPALAEQQVQWESNNYPAITWKTHPITGISNSVAQLTTDFDARNGKIQYKLTIDKVAQVPIRVYIELLDQNGAKLHEFSVRYFKFHPVAGTSLVEATDDSYCPEEKYKVVRDYVVR